MKRSKYFIIPIALITILSLVAPLANGRGNSASASGNPPPAVAYATRTDTTVALRDMPQIPPMPEVLGQIFQTRPPKHLPNREGSAGSSGPDPVLQESIPSTSAPSTGVNFEGINNVDGVLPPDTNGAIGLNYYVQIVNLSFAVYDRSGNLNYGPVNTNTLWQGFGGPCETTNDGDPVVLYDHLANRWLMSQFALPNFPRGPFYQCVAVSQSSNPLGAWYRYEFTISSNKLNDYPKFGVWSDGYYMSINQFKCNFVTCNWAGAGAVAFERDQMLQGGSARMVYFDLYSVDSNLGGMLPSDLDGPAPAAGTPNYFAQIDDNAWGYSPDQIQIWGFHVDWNNPSSSTFTFDKALPTAAFDSNMCNYARNCIPQPGSRTPKVDALSDRLMYRLQYRDFGTYQTLVTNHTVDVNGNDRAGVRWYELRDNGSGWDIFQQGTFSPDSANRWMGSIAMNGIGDIGLGYSVSSSSVYPSIHATGRLDGDTLGQMTQGEIVLQTGSGYQQHTSGRWGDYSMMSVDPVDDCTFWYTQEYYQVVGNAPWQTRIAAFKLRDCSTSGDNPPSVTITNPADGSTVSSSLSVTADASDDIGVTQVEFLVDGTSIGVDTSAPYSASWDTTTVSDGSHTLSAVATDSIGQTGSDSVSVTVANNTDSPPSVTITNPADGSTVSSSLSVTANASDDTGVTQVEFFVDSASIGVDATAPYSTTWDTTSVSDGAHTLSAVATDDIGQTGSDSVSVTVANNTGSPTSVHIGDLDGTSTNQGRTWTAMVTITVHDNTEALVSGATVYGSWSNGASGSTSCTTDSTGQCDVTLSGVTKRTGSVDFSVTNVTSSLAYNPADNHDPDGDSNGTTITVNK